jgi:hypothetical protein
MKTYTENSTNEDKDSLSNESKKLNGANPKFVDNRPETIAQLKMKEMLKNSQQTMQMKNEQERPNINTTATDELSKETIAPFQLKEDPTGDSKSTAGSSDPNKTGLPDNLKTGMESLSGMPLDDVNVHYNSEKPAQLQALAYAQGTDIHLGPGQEEHLPHELGHVVQQKKGTVKPTMQMMGKSEGVPVNDDPQLEREADLMGGEALQMKANEKESNPAADKLKQGMSALSSGKGPVQREEDPYAESSYEEEAPVSDPYAESSYEEEAPVSDPNAESSTEEEAPVSDPYAESSTEEEALDSDPYAESSTEEEALDSDPYAESSTEEEAPVSDPYAESSTEEEAPVSDPNAESSTEEEALDSDPYAESSTEEEALVSDPYAESSTEEEAPVSDPYAESSTEEEAPVSDPYAESSTEEEALDSDPYGESSLEEQSLVSEESPVVENEPQFCEMGELGTIPEFMSKLGYIIEAAVPSVGTGVEITASGAVAAEGLYVGLDAKISIERDENGLTGSLEVTSKIGLGVIAAGADTHGVITIGDSLEIKADDGVEFMNLGGLQMYNHISKKPDSYWEAFTNPKLYAIRKTGMGEIIANCLWGEGFPEYVMQNMDPLTLGGVENEEADAVSRTLSAGGEIAAEGGGGEDTEAGMEVAMGGSLKETTGVDESGALATESETNLSASSKIKVGEVEAEVKVDSVEGLECTLEVPYPNAAKGPAQAIFNSFNNVISSVINNILGNVSEPLSYENAKSVITNWQSPILAALAEHKILDSSVEFKVNVHPTKGVEIVVTLIYGASKESPKAVGAKGEVGIKQKTQILTLSF